MRITEAGLAVPGSLHEIVEAAIRKGVKSVLGLSGWRGFFGRENQAAIAGVIGTAWSRLPFVREPGIVRVWPLNRRG
jgi:hypothetical protein